MKKTLLIIFIFGFGASVLAMAKDKGETAHPTSQKKFTFE